MFCLMDVSGSMDEARKDLAKRFFILLYLFLTRHYEKIDLVFIRHHTQASEVNEDEFFHATESGGTVVSSALTLMHEIIRARYPAATGTSTARRPRTATTGSRIRQVPRAAGRPAPAAVRYYAYVQVADGDQNLWEEYNAWRDANATSRCRRSSTPAQIFPGVPRPFKKEQSAGMTARSQLPSAQRLPSPLGLDLRADRALLRRDRATPPSSYGLDTYPTSSS